MDLTCPYVKKVQKKVQQKEKEGYSVVIIGDEHHDEIKSIVSFAENPYIIADRKECSKLQAVHGKLNIVTQTTLILEEILPIIQQITLIAKEYTFENTICLSTETRQKEIVDLARRNDLLLLVGSTKSNNTNSLYRISKKMNELTFLVQDSDKLPEEINNVKSIAIASGASTPGSVIERIKVKIEK